METRVSVIQFSLVTNFPLKNLPLMPNNYLKVTNGEETVYTMNVTPFLRKYKNFMIPPTPQLGERKVEYYTKVQKEERGCYTQTPGTMT